MESDEKQSERSLVAFPSLIAISPEVKERAYELWSTVGGRNASAVRRLMEDEAEDGDAVPTAQAIRLWARQSGWTQRADIMIRETKDLTAYQLGVKYRAIMLGGADVLLRAQTGGYAGRELEGALAVKATEIGIKVIERGVLPLVVQPLPEAVKDSAEVSRDEREAKLKSAMVRRGKTG